MEAMPLGGVAFFYSFCSREIHFPLFNGAGNEFPDYGG